MHIVAEIVAGTEHFGICLVDGGFLGELFVQHFQGVLFRTVEKPAEKSEREDVAAFQHGLDVHVRVGQGSLCHGCDRHFNHLCRDAEFLDGVVGLEQGFFQAIGLEGVDVDDDHTAGLEEFVALLECGRIHGYQHIAFIARSVYAGAYADLETAHAAQRTLRGADFRGIIGECGNGVAHTGRYICEDVAGKLHAVAGVAGEADCHFLEGTDPAFGMCCVVHDNNWLVKIIS